MNNKLYVGNLSYQATGDDLRNAFSAYGDVEDAVVITDKFTNRSKGFGFVTMKNDEDAQKAIEALHESDFMGRSIVVNVARPKQPREDRPRR